MKSFFFILMILALASCSSFERMKYGHLKKVPATPQEFGSSNVASSRVCATELPRSENSDSLAPAVLFRTDSSAVVIHMVISTERATEKCVPPVLTPIPPEMKRQLEWKNPIRRDWSLLIGLLFLAGGLIALSMCIFFYPFAGLNFLWTIVLELFTLYAAWRLLGSGIVYFITRFRRKKNFSER